MWFGIGAAAPLRAQADHQHHAPESATEQQWIWSWDANVFAGWNYQYRKFRDFQEVESQNWLMGAAERPVAAGRLRLHGMLSFEPFTIQPLGSPQVFQTGETYQLAPLVDYQHPHDLFMNLGATWTKPLKAGRAFATVAAVGAPALGPSPFMHRPSAAENPTAPLSHHQLDATHITHGVVTAGVTRGEIGVEGSWFRGAEPDENRKDLELGALDSWSVRMRWQRGPWEAQASGGRLNSPEWVNPFDDVTRLTLSMGFNREDGTFAGLAAWGQNREIHGVLDAYLLEATHRWKPRHAWYSRAELVTKDILSPGRHTPGLAHLHPLSRIGALTGGYVFDVLARPGALLGVGGDLTVYRVDRNLRDNYGAPLSLHVFLRYRPSRASPHAHH
jgi:hypothetical protein